MNESKNNSNPTLRKAHKLLKRIVKKMGRPDLYYSAQIGVDSSRDGDLVTFAAMIGAPREGLAPVTFGAVDKTEFLDRLKDFLDNKIDSVQVERAFHEAQITLNERSTDYHKAQIEKLDNPEEETEAVEGEIVGGPGSDDNESVEESA